MKTPTQKIKEIDWKKMFIKELNKRIKESEERTIIIDKEFKELKKEIEETDKKLRSLL